VKRTGIIAIAVVGILAVGGGAFFGGTRYERSRILADPSVLFRSGAGVAMGAGPGFVMGAPQASGSMATRGDGNGGPMAVGGTMGTILSIEGNTLTLTTPAGATVTVQASDTTLVERNVSGTVADLSVGEQVMVAGPTNEDGSITARSITQRGIVFAPAGTE
jgi:hypothetical protein